MFASNRCSLASLLTFWLMLGFAPHAIATSIPINVSGYGYEGSDQEGLSVNAGNLFSAFSSQPGSVIVVDSGSVGVPISISIPIVPDGPFNTSVRVAGVNTDILSGSLYLFSTFTVTPSALISGSLTAPVSAFGSVSAFKDLTFGQGYSTPGPPLGTLQFSGQGTGIFYIVPIGDYGFDIVYATGSFKGEGNLSGVTTPEPASLLLVGTGMAGVAALFKRGRKRRAMAPD